MNKQKGLAPMLIVLLIAVAVGGYLLYQNQTKPTIVSQPSPSPVTSPTLTVSEEIANWKIYSDSEHKISFKYPQDWNESNEGDAVLISNGKFRLRFQYSPYPSIDFDKSYKKPDGTVSQNPVFIRIKIKNLEVGGYKATMYSDESTSGNQNKSFDLSVYFIKGSPVTMISGHTNDPSSKENLLSIFDQILSTFKFTQ